MGRLSNQLLFHYASPSYGRGVISLGGYTSGSAHADFALEPGEAIVGIGGKCGSYIDSIVIATSIKNTGRVGGSGGGPFPQFEVPHIARFTGLFGRARNVDRCPGSRLRGSGSGRADRLARRCGAGIRATRISRTGDS